MTPDEQRAALEKAARATCRFRGACFRDLTMCCDCPDVRDVTKIIATYLAATGREAEAAQVREAGDA